MTSLYSFARFLCQPRWAATALLLAAGPLARAQAPTWQELMVATGSAGSGSVNDMATDGAGNIYLAGSFNGSIQLGNRTLNTRGVADAFVAKWSPASRSFVWALQAGGTTNDGLYSVAVSGSSVYVAGSFGSPTADFGGLTVTNAQPSSNPNAFSSDGFVAKITDAGPNTQWTWVESLGGTGTDQANAIAVGSSGVYVTGQYGPPGASFGTLTLANTTSGTQFNSDGYLAKLNDLGAQGRFVWARRLGGNRDDLCTAIAASGSSVYVGGTLSDNASFSNTSLSAITGLFVARLDDAGPAPTLSWAVRGGSLGNDNLRSLVLNGPDVYIAGSFGGTSAQFGSTTLNNVSAGAGQPFQHEIFVARLSQAGPTPAFSWARRAGGAGYDQAGGLAVSGNSVYLAGSFLSTSAIFGTTTLTNFSTQPFPGPDLFLTRLTADTGSFGWTQHAGGAGVDYGGAVLVSGSRVYVAGGVNGPASFGSFPVPRAAPFATTDTLPFLASLTDLALAVNSPGPLAGIRLYPNPAAGQAIVELPGMPGATGATLTLTNALGQEVRRLDIGLSAAGSRYSLSLTGVAPGLYTLHTTAGAAVAVRRLLVE